MFSYGIRGLRERAEEIAGIFSVERNTVIIGNVGDSVEKFVGEGVEKLRGRRRGARSDIMPPPHWPSLPNT